MAPRLHRPRRWKRSPARPEVQSTRSPGTPLSWHPALLAPRSPGMPLFGDGGCVGQGKTPSPVPPVGPGQRVPGTGAPPSPARTPRAVTHRGLGRLGKAPLLFLRPRGTFTLRARSAVGSSSPPNTRAPRCPPRGTVTGVAPCPVSWPRPENAGSSGIPSTPGKLRHAEGQPCPSGSSPRGRSRRGVRVSQALGKPRSICPCESLGESAERPAG